MSRVESHLPSKWLLSFGPVSHRIFGTGRTLTMMSQTYRPLDPQLVDWRCFWGREWWIRRNTEGSSSQSHSFPEKSDRSLPQKNFRQCEILSAHSGVDQDWSVLGIKSQWLVNSYWLSGEDYCLHMQWAYCLILQGLFDQNRLQYLPIDMASYPRRESSTSDT